MEPAVLHAGIDGSAAFWIFIAAAVVISGWEKTRREAERHETLRRIMEKTGSIDETRLKELFKPAAGPSHWPTYPPGYGYRGLRVAGTIIMFIAAGLAVFFLILLQSGTERHGVMIGFASTSVLAMLGAGLFYSSRFAQRPPDQPGDKPPGR